jgi:hypothetical protein
MAKFIKFSVRNSAAAQPLGPTENILVNVEDIARVKQLEQQELTLKQL